MNVLINEVFCPVNYHCNTLQSVLFQSCKVYAKKYGERMKKIKFEKKLDKYVLG